MSTLEQFLLYNLLPGLVTGALAWVAVLAGTELLRIRHGSLRFCLLGFPLVKSTLVVLGVGMVLPWPREVFGAWHANALPLRTVLPAYLAITVAVLTGRALRVRRARQLALRDTVPAEESSPRLVRALDRVMTAYESQEARLTGVCQYAPIPGRPELLVTGRSLHSPLVVTTGQPAIVFPERLVHDLTDKELQGAMAHEVAHLCLRRHTICSTENVRAMVAVNPMAALMAAQLHREEEKACDDMATVALGDPQTYAEMLLKSYRFATRGAVPVFETLQYVPQLLGIKPMLSERIERLLDRPKAEPSLRLQYVAASSLSVALWLIFFSDLL